MTRKDVKRIFNAMTKSDASKADIGLVYDCMIKQIPAKPEYNDNDECYECSDCGWNLGVGEKPSYCPDCGKAILWINEHEEAMARKEARAEYEIARRRDEGQ